MVVPVRLNAARWRSGKGFEPWLAEQLVQNHGLSDRDAARLVRDRRVLPVMDGLDELDSARTCEPAGRTGTRATRTATVSSRPCPAPRERPSTPRWRLRGGCC
ncbi:hypothetical protein GCM10023085_57850 [Actinomadura viridis]